MGGKVEVLNKKQNKSYAKVAESKDEKKKSHAPYGKNVKSH